MSHNFKVGDSALVIGGNTFLGCQVDLVQWVMPGEHFTLKGEDFTFGEGGKRGGWIVRGETSYSIKPECHLMPLRGDLAPEQQKSREVVA